MMMSSSPPTQTTVNDAVALLSVISDKAAALEWLALITEKNAELVAINEDMKARQADIKAREELLQQRTEQVAQAAAEAAQTQRTAEEKLASLQAMLA